MKHEASDTPLTDLLLEEFPTLRGKVSEGSDGFALCLAWHTQQAAEAGDLKKVKQHLAFVERVWLLDLADLNEFLTSYFFAQLDPTATVKPRGRIKLLQRITSRIKQQDTGVQLGSLVSPKFQKIWRQAVADRGGTLTELDFLKEARVLCPSHFKFIDEESKDLTFAILPHVDSLFFDLSHAISEGDAAAFASLVAFIERFLQSGTTTLRADLDKELARRMGFRGDFGKPMQFKTEHGKAMKKLLPACFLEHWLQITAKRKQEQEDVIRAAAERAKYYQTLPAPLQPILLRLDKSTGVGFSPAPAEDLAWLRELGLPEPVVQIYAVANPMPCGVEKHGITFVSAKGVHRADSDDFYWLSVRKLGLIVFATAFDGDVFAFDLRRAADPQNPPVRRITHDSMDPFDGIADHIKEARGAGDNTPEPELVKQYWDLFLKGRDCLYPVYAKNLLDFLRKLAK